MIRTLQVTDKGAELFVGITSWNSERFLPYCLEAINTTTKGVNTRIVVIDNRSQDGSAEIATAFGAEVIVRACDQGDALNFLVRESGSKYSLLLHSDVILLSKNWFRICESKIDNKTILVSPEDIGCGPYSRPFGIGMPESSFLFFDTKAMLKMSGIVWRKSRFIPLPIRALDFYGDHITHNLPGWLSKNGLNWFMMDVHVSDSVADPIHEPSFKPAVWSEELGHLRYGLGNFYSIDGEITHYHNWFDRIDLSAVSNSTLTTNSSGRGFSVAYVKAYTEAFLKDYSSGRLVIPEAVRKGRRPVAL